MRSDKLGLAPVLFPVAAQGLDVQPAADPDAMRTVARLPLGPQAQFEFVASDAREAQVNEPAPDSGDQPLAEGLEVATTDLSSNTAPAPIAHVPIPLNVHQRMYVVALGKKREALQHLLTTQVPVQTLIFTRTKHGADKISRFLERVGFKSAAIHGDKSHGARTRALAGFKAGEITLLVATDIAARGLDIESLPVVINYDLPHIADDYVQRVARAANGPETGLALSLITQEESPQFRAVRGLLAGEIELLSLTGFEAAEAFDPDRDPPPQRLENEAAATEPAVRPAHTPRPPRPPKGAPGSRRERGGRHERGPRTDVAVAGDLPPGEGVPATEGEAAVPVAAKADRGPRPERVARPDRGPRPERGPNPERKPRVERERGPRPDRGSRLDRGPRGERAPVMRGDEQPFGPEPVFPDDAQNFGDDPSNAVDFSEVEGRVERGNSALPQPAMRTGDADNRRRRRNGRLDPFAPVEVNEEQSSIYDERQPEDYRDQWSVLGPTAGRPAWTFADQSLQPVADPRVRSDAQPRSDPSVFARAGERRPGPPRPGGPRQGQGQPRPGQPRSGQPRQGQPRHGRPKRADGR